MHSTATVIVHTQHTSKTPSSCQQFNFVHQFCVYAVLLRPRKESQVSHLKKFLLTGIAAPVRAFFFPEGFGGSNHLLAAFEISQEVSLTRMILVKVALSHLVGVRFIFGNVIVKSVPLASNIQLYFWYILHFLVDRRAI